MTKINWKDNSHAGAFVERSLRALEDGFALAKTPNQKMAYLGKYAYIWQIKASIAKVDRQNEEIESLKKEVAELKKLAGLAQVNQIST